MQRLPQGYVVIRDLPWKPGYLIDNIVIGPTGVFVIITGESGEGTGQRQDYVGISSETMQKIENCRIHISANTTMRHGLRVKGIVILPKTGIAEFQRNFVRAMPLSHVIPYVTGHAQICSPEDVQEMAASIQTTYNRDKQSISYRKNNGVQIVKILLFIAEMIFHINTDGD